MSVDPHTFYEGVTAPTASDPTGAEGQAPPVSPPVAPEPGQQTGQGDQNEVDFRALSEQYRQQAEDAQQRAAQNEAQVTRIRAGLEQYLTQQQQQQRQAQYQQRLREMTTRANTMQQEDAERYIQNETQNIINEFQNALAMERQQAAVREQQIARTLGAPLYIEKLVKDNKLPAEAREKLLAYGDPDLAERVGVPMLKDYYQQKAEWEERLTQASRSNQAQQRANSGLNRLGGNNPPATPAFEVPDGLSKEQQAIWIYDNVIHGG